jgi:hypothetical protein
MASLKAVKAIQLAFALDSRCAGLEIVHQLTAPRLRKTNPECKVDFNVRFYSRVKKTKFQLMFDSSFLDVC